MNNLAARLTLALLMLIALIGLFGTVANAQVDGFELEVYPAQTLAAGMVELESLNNFVPHGHSVGGLGSAPGSYPSEFIYRSALELSYGLTDRLEVAAYLNLARPNAASLQYAGSKYRIRGSIAEPGELPVNLGWEVELEWHRIHQFDDNELEVEIKPLIDKEFGPVEIDLNPIFEKAIFIGPEKNLGFEFGYAAGAYFNWMREISPGLEFYGGIGLIDDSDPLSEQQHYVFPVIRGEIAGIEYNLGPGIGLTRGSDQVITKLNLELEHFVGSLFE